MKKDEDNNLTEESFEEQLLGIYNEIFNHKNYNEYTNGIITLDKYSYDFIMDATSL